MAAPRPRLTIPALVLLGLAALTVARAAWLTWSPGGVPTWDTAMYLLDALKLEEKLVAGDAAGFVKELTRPDLHPPGHKLALAAWMAAVGTSAEAARLWPTFTLVLSLLLCLPLGRLVAPSAGLLVGAGAALLTSLGLGQLDLVTNPMTESTALPVTLGALWVLVATADRVEPRARLYAGLAVLVGGLVRYNLAPMLLAPLCLHHVLGAARGRRRWVDPSVILWVLPTLLVYGAWQLARPDLLANIQRFVQNRTSGLEFWSAANLLWVPRTIQGTFLTAWLVSGAVLLLFVLGLRPTREPAPSGRRLLQLYVLVAFGVLTLHDFKVDRNLVPVLPALHLCALAALDRLLAARPWLLPVALLPFFAWQHVVSVPEVERRADFRPDPVVREVLDFLVRQGEARPRTWVVGWVFRISPGLIDYTFRSAGSPTRLELDQRLFGEQTRSGVDAPWNDQYPAFVHDTMLAREREATSWITIETVPGTRYFDGWKAFGNHYARAFAEQEEVPEVDRLHLVDAGVLVRVYRLGEAPSAATRAALDEAPRPEDDAGIVLPAEVLHRDPLRGGGPGWTLYPPEALGVVTVTRGPSSVQLDIPAAQERLQLCGRPGPLPARPVRAVLHLATEGLAGRAWVHLRGMDEREALQHDAANRPDITQAGPLGSGPQRVDVLVSPYEASTRLRPCLVLDGVTGRVVVDDYALVPPDAALPGGASGDPPLPEGRLRARITFAGPDHGWRLVGEGASLETVAGELRLRVDVPQERLSACGPPIPWEGAARGVVTGRTEGWTGKAWFHYRPLDAGGVLVTRADGAGAIVHAGPFTGTGELRAVTPLEVPAATRSVRPCLVLDGGAGTLALADLAFVGPAD